MTFAPLGGRENFGRLGRAAAVTCLVIGTVHRIHVSLHVIRQGMSRAIHRKPFSFSRLSILAYVHSPFNDHGEPVSSLLDRTLRLKAAVVRFFAHPSYVLSRGLCLIESDLVMGHLVDLDTSNTDQEIVGEQTSLLGQTVLDNLEGMED